VRQIIGPAGSEVQRLPPTVATFQTLNEPNRAVQAWWKTGWQVQLGEGAGGGDLEAVGGDRERGPAHGLQVDEAGEVDAWVGEQLGPAGQGHHGVAERGQVGARAGRGDGRNGGQVHPVSR
jgi:hypothetical protein